MITFLIFLAAAGFAFGMGGAPGIIIGVILAIIGIIRLCINKSGSGGSFSILDDITDIFD